MLGGPLAPIGAATRLTEPLHPDVSSTPSTSVRLTLEETTRKPQSCQYSQGNFTCRVAASQSVDDRGVWARVTEAFLPFVGRQTCSAGPTCPASLRLSPTSRRLEAELQSSSAPPSRIVSTSST